jgi:Mg-chelatase subunit ChlD
MTFLHPGLLLLALLPAAWAAWEWRASSRRGALLLKAGALVAVAAALAQPRLTVFESRVAVVMLADTSASISDEDLASESALANQLERARGRHWTAVVPFARDTRNPAPEERSRRGWQFGHAVGEAGRATNLEAALRDATASLPAAMVPRLLLVSDGNENSGSVTRAIWQARQLGIPIDTIPLEGRPRPALVLQSVSFPGQVFSGERFPVEVTVESPRATPADVEMTAEGKTIGTSRVPLAAGTNHLTLQASVNSSGAIALAGEISAAGLGETRFEDAVALRRPRVLLVSRDPALSEQHLVRALEANQFEVDRSTANIPARLDPYQLVVINNWDMQWVPRESQLAVEDFVKKGGGLVWIAGEHNVYVAKPGEEEPLERTLPAKLRPPRDTEGTAVVLIIDKSSSMEGRKMELAKLAAVGVVDNLRPVDQVGVLIFDNSFQWAVPIGPADDPDRIKGLISGIVADGGTQIAPALTEAYQRILPRNAVYKHIVLLTDGISEEGDAMALARQALANRITISTVGLGQDVNRAFLERVAETSEGQSYFMDDPSGLERLLLRDVEEHTGVTAVEKAITPRILKRAEILDGVGMESAPPLRGYIRFRARPTADAILEADRGDPLLVRWQYGLGRVVVFTSDAKNRWAINWVAWPGFDKLWANVFRDLLPHAAPSEATADFDAATGELVVDYRLSRSVPEPDAGGQPLPDVFAFGPNGFQAPLKIGKVAAGHYRGRLSLGPNQGLFRVRPLADLRAFPEVGFYRQEEEMREYGHNDPLLRQIAEATGGRFRPSPRQVFDARGRGNSTVMNLWPGLLALAVALNLVELVLRKWRGLVPGKWAGLRWFGRRVSAAA